MVSAYHSEPAEHDLETRLFITSQKVVRYCVGSQSYGDCILGCRGNCTYWLSWAMQRNYRNLVRWSDRKTSDGIEGEETKIVMSRSAVSPGQRVISSIGCHSISRIRTTPSPIIFARRGFGWGLHRVLIKKQLLWFFLITFANKGQFSKLFHWHSDQGNCLCICDRDFHLAVTMLYTTLQNLKMQNNFQTPTCIRKTDLFSM